MNCDFNSTDNHWCKYYLPQLNKAGRTDALFVLYHMDIRRALSITRLYLSGIAIFQTKQKQNTMFLEGIMKRNISLGILKVFNVYEIKSYLGKNGITFWIFVDILVLKTYIKLANPFDRRRTELNSRIHWISLNAFVGRTWLMTFFKH